MGEFNKLPLSEAVINWFFDSINNIQNRINNNVSDNTKINTKNKNNQQQNKELKSCASLEEIKWKHKPMNIYYQNVRNLCNKNHTIKPKTFELEYDVILLTETAFTSDHMSEEYFCDQYSVYRCDRSSLNSVKSSGGGSLIAIKMNDNYVTEEINLTAKKI